MKSLDIARKCIHDAIESLDKHGANVVRVSLYDALHHIGEAEGTVKAKMYEIESLVNEAMSRLEAK